MWVQSDVDTAEAKRRYRVTRGCDHFFPDDYRIVSHVQSQVLTPYGRNPTQDSYIVAKE